MIFRIGLLIVLASIGIATLGQAGTVVDVDGDHVPDEFDNCLLVPNGPGDASYQQDADVDGYGNACDCDYNNDGAGDAQDFFIFLIELVNSSPILNRPSDSTGDNITSLTDFSAFVACLVPPPGQPQIGPSGIICAGTTPCLP